jgi:hypothetical protein
VQNGPAGEAKPHAAASLEPTPQVGICLPMGDQQRLPVTPALLADLLEQAARARRLAIMIEGDPAAPRLRQMAEEVGAVIARLSRLE